MDILRLAILSLAFVLFALGAIILPANTALADHCKGKHKKDPGCSNDPGAEIPISVTFDCPDAMGRTCSSDPMSGNSDGLQGDVAAVPYIDGLDDVKAHIRESGILQLGTAAKGQKPGKRNIYWDFSPGLILASGNPLVTTDGLTAGSHLSKIQVGRGTENAIDFKSLVKNVPVETNLWGDLAITPDKGSKEWVFIRFEDTTAIDQCPEGSDPTTVTVTLLDDTLGARQWEIVGDANATACIQGTDHEVVLGPFRFVAQEQ